MKGMRAWVSRFGLVGLVLVVACDSAAEPGPSGSADASPDADLYCHYDCFGFHECENGVVTSWDHTPIPCDVWAGECPHYKSYFCERGCRMDVSSIEPFEEPRAMCEENRPKQIGDSCAEPSQCDPQVATIEYVDGVPVVTNVYLECDLALGECVEREPPVVVDYLALCGLEAPLDGPGLSYGVRDSAICSGGLCIYVEQESCVRQGCTISCDSDDDCPMGFVCNGNSYCKPGPPDLWGTDVLPLLGC